MINTTRVGADSVAEAVFSLFLSPPELLTARSRNCTCIRLANVSATDPPTFLCFLPSTLSMRAARSDCFVERQSLQTVLTADSLLTRC